MKSNKSISRFFFNIFMNRWATAEAIAAATEAIAAAAEAVGPPPRLLRWPTRPLQPPPTPLGHHRGRWAAAEAVGPPRRLLRPPPMPFRQAQRPLQRPPRPLWRHSKRWGYHYSFFFTKCPTILPKFPEMGRISVKNWPLGGLVMPKNASGGLSGLVRGPAHH